jgi:DivIVA domain-containing protein
MDVTPRELRDIDIPTAKFGGYKADDVDELLERAAATIEALNERIRRQSEQVSEAESVQGKTRETEEMLHRTLLLAQRAADEAVAEAQVKARQILDDSDTKARATLAEAESNARRQAESERRRLESEVLELGARREALLADVDGLEQFESEYRTRLRRALEVEMQSLTAKSSVAPSPRPTIHEVDLPAPAEGVAPRRESPAPSPVVERTPPPAPPSAARPPADASGPPTADVASVPAWEASPAREAAPPRPMASPPVDAPPIPPAPGAPSPTAGTAPSPSTPAAPRPPLFDEDPPEPESLDDDQFFASLREAVTDETPLGPRDDQPERALFDQDDASRSSLFRRRGR